MSGIVTKTEVHAGGVGVYKTSIYCPECGDNYKIEGQSFTASGDTTLGAWEVMGRIAATGKVVPIDKDAVDGSQYPCGVLYLGTASSRTVLDTVTVNDICLTIGGKFDFNGLVFSTAGTDLDSVVDGRTIFDLLINKGFIPFYSTENTSATE